MGKRKRLRTNKGIPEGVYKTPNGRYRTYFWDGQRKKNVGRYDTAEEAEYALAVAKNGHHWIGMKDGPYFGFIYRITHKVTGKMYIGSKQFFHWDGPPAGYKCCDLESSRWDEKAWKYSGWKEYSGSSRDLSDEVRKQGAHMFHYKIEKMCKDKLDLHLTEIFLMVGENVLEALTDKGEYQYYNKNIASCEFRQPYKLHEIEGMHEEDMEAVRNYYLKPDRCPLCTRVLPYGSIGACCAVSRDSEIQTGGGFSDVR